MTSRLAAIEASFVRFLQKPAPTSTLDPASVAELNALLGENPRLDASAQFEIYRDQFHWRHRTSLEEDFPTVLALLGAHAFDAVAQSYLERHPPTHYDLRAFGQAFTSHLEERFPSDTVVLEAARLDWAYMHAFDAEDAPPFDPSSLARIREEALPEITLDLAPSLSLLAFAFPVTDIRDATRRGQVPKRPDAAAQHVAVYRIGWELRRRILDPAPFSLLRRLQAGEALGAACEAIATEAPNVTADLGIWFSSWTSEGWIRRVRVPGASDAPPAGN